MSKSGSARRQLKLLKHVLGARRAIFARRLDVQLLDRDITPVVLQLIVMRTPIIIHTGTGLPEALHSTGIALPVVTKPTAPEKILDLLSAEMKKRPLG